MARVGERQKRARESVKGARGEYLKTPDQNRKWVSVGGAESVNGVQVELQRCAGESVKGAGELGGSAWASVIGALGESV